jgi:hypothetical protein
MAVIVGLVVIAMVAAGVGIAAAVAITSPDPPSGPQPAVPLRVPDFRPAPDRCLGGRRDCFGSPLV